MRTRNAYCSFCRKGYKEVGPLVEGPGDVYICGECIELCQSIIEQEVRRRNPSGDVGPAVLRSKLNRLIVEQEEAKQVLIKATRSRHEVGARVLLIGSSCSAKIFLARALAHALEVPFAAGNVGDLVSSKHGSLEVLPLFFRLLQTSDFDIEQAKRGVVFVEGAEKLATQAALLRLWQEDISRPMEKLDLPVRGILFICGGTFDSLDDAGNRGDDSEQSVTVERLKRVGARPEWADRLTGIARVSPLDDESLSQVIQCLDFHSLP